MEIDISKAAIGDVFITRNMHKVSYLAFAPYAWPSSGEGGYVMHCHETGKVYVVEKDGKAPALTEYDVLSKRIDTGSWYIDGLHNLLNSINPSEEQNNKPLRKLVQLVQLLAQKAAEQPSRESGHE